MSDRDPFARLDILPPSLSPLLPHRFLNQGDRTMSATQVFQAVRAAAPTANPFVAIAVTLHARFYPDMSTFFLESVKVLHGLYAV